ncbi:MAG TPA: hypothetical protein VN193_11240 [Candidatus Angelobacter sp.]|jgi:hypothetical protein|nr:hypothetical protein [Candidatus Angelobacter sp.]
MRARPIAFLGAALLLLSACGGGGGGGASPTPAASSTPDLASRPSSPATLEIASPTANEVVHGTSLHVAVALQNATVVKTTTTQITPTEGHVHLYLDNQLIYMAYSLQQDVPVHPGVYTLRAEFVASDHFPFNPRVYSQSIVFSVAQ